MTLEPPPPADGSDDAGKSLPLTVRIGIDGRMYFHDLTMDLLPVAIALCPGDKLLQQRLDASRALMEVRRT